MRSPSFLLASAATLAIAACGILQFGVGYDIAEQLVPGSPTGGLLDGNPVEIPLDLDLTAQTDARSTGPAQHVYLTSFTLSVTATANLGLSVAGAF